MMQLVITLLLSGFSVMHDFHVTLTTLHYNSSKQSVEITIRLAVEDLEKALKEQGADNLRIGTKYEDQSADALIRAYIQKHLKLSPNSSARNYQWVGKELSEDLHDLFIYCELTDCNLADDIQSMQIENTLLTDVLPDQVNIVSLEFGDKTQRLTFTRANAKNIIHLQ